MDFRCGLTRLKYSLKKFGKPFKLPKEMLKTEKHHDEVDGDHYLDKKADSLDYVKQDMLGTAFSYARYCKAMEEITGFSMKDSLSAPGLRWKYFNELRLEEDEPIYTYNDNYKRWFVQQSIKGVRVCSFNQHYKSKNCDDVLKILSEEVNVERNVYDITEAYLNYKNEHLKIIKEEYENNFIDYRDIDEQEMKNYMNEKVGEFPIHKFLKELRLNDLLRDFDAVSLYPSAMSEQKINFSEN